MEIKKYGIYICDLPRPCEENERTCVQYGERPCIVVSNGMCNKFSNALTIIPITSQNKTNLPTHIEISGLPLPSIALCEQIITLDKDRILREIKMLTGREIVNIIKAIIIQLELR